MKIYILIKQSKLQQAQQQLNDDLKQISEFVENNHLKINSSR